MKTFAILMFTALLAQAQPNPDPNRILLEGTTTGPNGQPVSGVKLTLTGDFQAVLDISSAQGPAAMASAKAQLPRGRTTTSDARGQFLFEGVTPGRYVLSAELDGYVKQGYGGRPGSSKPIPFDVVAGTSFPKITIAMLPTGSLTGRVSGPTGDPAPGVGVHAVAWTYVGGRRRLQAYGTSAKSGPNGAYRISGLPPGRYFAYTDAAEPRPTVATLPEPRRQAFLPTYAPSALDPGAAASVQIYPGSEGQADIRVRQTALYTIRGIVKSATGGTPAGAVIMLLRDQEGPYIVGQGMGNSSRVRDPLPPLPYMAMRRVDAEGRFELQEISPGTHTIMAFGGQKVGINVGAGRMMSVGGASATEDDGATGSQTVTVLQEDLVEVEIRLQPAGELTRNIHVENSSFEEVFKAILATGPNAPQGLAARIQASVPVVNLIPEGRVSSGGQFPDSTTGNPTQKVSSGRYLLEIVGMPLDLYVKSVRLGGNDFTGKPIDFAGGSAELDILVAQGPAQVTGQISSSKGEPVAGAVVSVWPVKPDLSKPTAGASMRLTSMDGTFRVVGLPPGEYFVAAFDELPDLGLGIYPPFLNRMTSQAVRVKLEEKGLAAATPKLVTAEAAAYEIGQLP